MTPFVTSATNGPDPLPTEAADDLHARLTFDLDVDLCVIGAGLAGLSVALEAAQLGLSVAVLEGRRVGWAASSATLGSVLPGFGVPIGELIERVGAGHAGELWALSREGMDIVRDRATEQAMPGIALSSGALEVSNVDLGDRLVERLQTLGTDFGSAVEGWPIDRVREVLRTRRYFHAIHFPDAFQLDGRRYVRGLEAMARRAGVRIFEDTPALGIDSSGIRKRIVTPHARLRASDIVLAGNVHLGAASPRLTRTLLPMWRVAALTAPLGAQLADVIAFTGSIADTHDVDHYRIVGGDRLLWTGPETTFAVPPKRLEGLIRRRIATLYPQLGSVAIERSWSAPVGQTVHGMPQIGELRRGLWVASGFGRQGLATTAIAGRLIAQGIVRGDQRWRLFDPFELVWAGGKIGRVVGQGVAIAERRTAIAAGLLARYREGAAERNRQREERREAANQNVQRSAMLRPPSPPKGVDHSRHNRDRDAGI